MKSLLIKPSSSSRQGVKSVVNVYNYWFEIKIEYVYLRVLQNIIFRNKKPENYSG